MKKGCLLIIAGMLVLFVTIMPSSQVLGNESPNELNEKLVGPTMWGVGVVTLTQTGYIGTLRIKRIEGCDVSSLALSYPLTALPSENDVLWYRLPEGSVFGLCNLTGHQPIITKVKNFVKIDDGTTAIASFDAEIQFVVPSNYSGTVCE
jgi:hypothetical protein